MSREAVHAAATAAAGSQLPAAAETFTERTLARERGSGYRGLAIVPALNEERTVGRVVEEVRSFDPDLEIVVVDDGSEDRTAEVATNAGANVLRLPFNLGIGGAVQTGYRYAVENGFDLAVQIDADGQHDPSELPALLRPVVAGEADIVIGSRFAGSASYRAPISRRLGIRLFAAIVSLMVGQRLTDTSSSFRAVNRRGLKVFAADYPHGYLETVEATVMAARSGLCLKEVPVAMRERAEGRSTLTTPLSVFYAAKVLVALFVGFFRRTTVDLSDG